MTRVTFEKTEDAELEFGFDGSETLETLENITVATFTFPQGPGELTDLGIVNDGKRVAQKFGGGTLGQIYLVVAVLDSTGGTIERRYNAAFSIEIIEPQSD